MQVALPEEVWVAYESQTSRQLARTLGGCSAREAEEVGSLKLTTQRSSTRQAQASGDIPLGGVQYGTAVGPPDDEHTP